MSRLIKDDYIRLIEFLKKYSLLPLIESDDFLNLLSQQHKYYYALLIFLTELKYQDFDPTPIYNSQYSEVKQKFFNYLEESISDIGTAFFVCLHGCYKASGQILRSSIENFIKSISSVESPKILTQKNMNLVLEIASKTKFYQNTETKKLFSELKGNYTELCKTVHTATVQDMQHITALGNFPTFNIAKAIEVKSKLIRISKNYISTLTIYSPNVVKSMYHNHRDIILKMLPPNIKRKIMVLES